MLFFLFHNKLKKFMKWLSYKTKLKSDIKFEVNQNFQ